MENDTLKSLIHFCFETIFVPHAFPKRMNVDFKGKFLKLCTKFFDIHSECIEKGRNNNNNKNNR